MNFLAFSIFGTNLTGEQIVFGIFVLLATLMVFSNCPPSIDKYQIERYEEEKARRVYRKYGAKRWRQAWNKARGIKEPPIPTEKQPSPFD